MEKIVTCGHCEKAFKVSGPVSSKREISQSVPCPFCGKANEVMWAMDSGFTTIPKRRAARHS